MKDLSALISQIEQAFAAVQLEEGIGLGEADAVDSYADAATRAARREKDEKQSWKRISSADLNHYYCSLSFFDAKGMRFHLPAFMIAEIKGEYRFGMAFALTQLSDYSKSQFSLLTTQQRKAVCSFLEWLAESPDYEFERTAIKDALEKYWLKTSGF
jgi:hypothetical protein